MPDFVRQVSPSSSRFSTSQTKPKRLNRARRRSSPSHTPRDHTLAFYGGGDRPFLEVLKAHTAALMAIRLAYPLAGKQREDMFEEAWELTAQTCDTSLGLTDGIRVMVCISSSFHNDTLLSPSPSIVEGASYHDTK